MLRRIFMIGDIFMTGVDIFMMCVDDFVACVGRGGRAMVRSDRRATEPATDLTPTDETSTPTFRVNYGEGPNDVASASRVLRYFAWQLYVTMPKQLQRDLGPRFVDGLREAVDSSQDCRRAEYMCVETVRRLVAPLCRAAARDDFASRCEAVLSVQAAETLMTEICTLDVGDYYSRLALCSARNVTRCTLEFVETFETFEYVPTESGLPDFDDRLPFICGDVCGVALLGMRAKGNSQNLFEIAVSIFEDVARIS